MAIPQSSIIALSLMYTKLPPSASDLTYWASPAGQAVSWEQAVQAFSTSSAAKTAYPMLASPTVLSQNAAARRDYVTQAFQNLYGIAAAAIPAAELTYWADTYLVSSPQAIFDFPVVLNQYSPAARQQALTNRAQVAENFAVAMAADGSSTFTSAQYSSGWVIVNTVTADAASVTAANAQIAQFIAGGGGGTGTTFTLLENGAVLTASANNKVAPAGNLTASNNTVQALTFLNGSFVQDPSTADADVLTAQILGVGLVTPNITNIETIEFTGSTGAEVNIVNISGVKSFVIKSGDLKVETAEKFPLTLAAGYANKLSLQLGDATKASTVNLNGTVAGTTIVDLNSEANVNIVVKADSVLKNSDAALYTIKSVAGSNNFVISGDKNLTIDGNITVTAATDRLDATDFTGKLTLNLGAGSNITQIVGGKSDDTFTLTAAVDQINGVALNGNDGNDTLTVKVGATPAAINGVTNVETIIFKQAATDTTIATVDTLVASGATLTVDASSFTTKFLDFDGTFETNGSFKITGGALADTLKGGAKNDTLIGGGGIDTLTGGGGNDQFVLNKAAPGNGVVIKDFTAVANNNDVFALSNAAFAGAPAVGATLAVSTVAGATNSANTILVDIFANLTANQTATSNVRFGYDTTNKQLFYDADGNFSVGTVLIATSTLAVNLNASNFAIVA
ncbi:MAG: calcium-binding protein [Microcystis aeruginosa G13-12]|nr:calcium-binding protein [Microcystis aeruginosa G13-12]NCT51829.1 calcium-binding protein [Microcystis aeruginosa G13-03]